MKLVAMCLVLTFGCGGTQRRTFAVSRPYVTRIDIAGSRLKVESCAIAYGTSSDPAAEAAAIAAVVVLLPLMLLAGGGGGGGGGDAKPDLRYAACASKVEPAFAVVGGDK